VTRGLNASSLIAAPALAAHARPASRSPSEIQVVLDAPNLNLPSLGALEYSAAVQG
jgi:hypothetical protein